MQLIFVVEASKESKSDFYYISETLKELENWRRKENEYERF